MLYIHNHNNAGGETPIPLGKLQNEAFHVAINGACTSNDHWAKTYHAGFREAFKRDPQNFFDVPKSRYDEPDHGVAVLLRDGTSLAGLHYKRTVKPDHLAVEIKGLFSTFPGAGTALVAKTLVEEQQVYDLALRAEAEVRVFPDGECNVASCAAFSKLGFYAKSVRSHRILDKPVAQHLIETADSAGFISTLVLQATDRALERCVPHAITSFWRTVCNA